MTGNDSLNDWPHDARILRVVNAARGFVHNATGAARNELLVAVGDLNAHSKDIGEVKRPDTLNRCPFCLPERSQPNLTKRSAASHFVECLCCMATGPLCGDEPTAIRTWNEGCFGARQSSEILGNTVDAHVEFWKAEYKSLARAGVERMAEFGYQVDPAEKMIEAAEYREKMILGKPREPKREISKQDTTEAQALTEEGTGPERGSLTFDDVRPVLAKVCSTSWATPDAFAWAAYNALCKKFHISNRIEDGSTNG